MHTSFEHSFTNIAECFLVNCQTILDQPNDQTAYLVMEIIRDYPALRAHLQIQNESWQAKLQTLIAQCQSLPGSGAAQFLLGYCYLRGIGLLKNHEQAIHFLEQGSKLHHPTAITYRAWMHKMDKAVQLITQKPFVYAIEPLN